jgi:hypothetical protein
LETAIAQPEHLMVHTREYLLAESLFFMPCDYASIIILQNIDKRTILYGFCELGAVFLQNSQVFVLQLIKTYVANLQHTLNHATIFLGIATMALFPHPPSP